jgi:hypothetical protein
VTRSGGTVTGVVFASARQSVVAVAVSWDGEVLGLADVGAPA